MFCDTPGQSVVAALVGGLVGGATGSMLGFGIVGVAVLAGALGGLGDIVFHVVRNDKQFREAVAEISD